MKLIDFNKSIKFNDIFKEMGIKPDDVVSLNNEINFNKLTLDEVELQKIEDGIGLDILLDDLEYGKSDTIQYKGKNVILYIRDQYGGYGNNKNNGYKYHISWCSQINKMSNNKKIDRYVISRRTDGYFYVNILDNRHDIAKEDELIKMNVCKICLKKIKFIDTVENFSIQNFLRTYSTNYKQLPKYEAKDAPLNVYPKNWKDISIRYRESKGYICESCGLNCSNNKGYLDVHHIDSNKYNVNRSNLKALCKKCHGNEFGHGHYKALNKKRGY